VVPTDSAVGPDTVIIVSGSSTTIATLRESADRGASTLFLTSVAGIAVNSVIGVGLTYSGIVTQVNAGANSVTLNTDQPTGALNMHYPGIYLKGGATLNNLNQEPTPVRLLTATRYRIDSVTDPLHPILEQRFSNGFTEPVAEDIEDLQIAYGVDVNNNRIIETGEWVNQPTTNQIDQIRLVRITIVARTAQPDPVLRGVATLAQTVPAIENRPERPNLTDGYRRYILTRIIKTRNLDAVFTL
jgi:hypothetical protein